MPSLTIPIALLQLTDLGIPWDYPAWQEATGVHHGLFSADPAHRPKGMTAQDASDIQAFLSRYLELNSDVKKASFLSDTRGTILPGRKKWQNWVNSLWRSSGFQAKIIAVFSAHNCHPLTRALAAPKAKVENPKSAKERRKWPSGGMWIPLCLDDIASELFGEESLEELGSLPEAYRHATQAIAQRTWTSLTRRIERAQARVAVLEEEATNAFNGECYSFFFIALDEQNLTKAAITTVIRAVAKWRNVIELIKTPDNLRRVKDMETELDRLMEGLGMKISEEKKKKKRGKSPAPRLFAVSNEMLRTLATDKAIHDVIALYHEFFDNPSNAVDDVPLLEQPMGIPFDEAVHGADVGTEYEANKTRQQLATNLGLVEELPLLFNNYRHSAGLTRWAKSDLFKFDDPANPPPDISNLELHWHQLAGVHAILRTCFTEEPLPEHCTGMLVADEVGLGKTYQSAAVIACLADAVIRQNEGLKMAPLFEARPYLAGQKDIPSLPHLILVPGTLTSQWFDELRILFQPGGVDLFVYPTAEEERRAFWDADGAFYLSKHAPSNKIVLSPHSALTKDYGSLYRPMRNMPNDLPWTIPPLLSPKTRGDITKTLFGQQYLSVIIDEAHNFRNHGPKHLAALAILENAIVRLPHTGTPLQTATKDLAAMGRLTGLPYFFTAAAFEEEREDIRALRRAKREMQDNGDATDDNEQDLVKLRQITIAQRMQRQSEGHILRRTTASLNWKGEELVPLPPCETIYAYLDLTERELLIITENGQGLEEMIGTANLSHKIITRGFYIEYRLSLIFARANPKSPLPEFDNLEEWDEMKSTKLDMAARLCQYFLTRDDLPLPTFANGTVHFPSIPSVRKGEKLSKACKIVVFTEFPSMLSLFINVFKLYGVKVLAVNGKMPFDKRAAIIKKFRESSTYRVLALSSVGTTGINLAFCRIVIFLDQPWSAQDIRQMRGRVHRQPQKNQVICIHLLANETSDIIVDGMARGKRDMMEAFLSKKVGQDLFQLLSGGGELDSDGDEEAPETKPKKKSSKSNSVKKQRSATSVKSKGKARAVPAEDKDEDEDEEVEVAISITPGKHQRLSKHKSAEFIEDSDLDSRAPPITFHVALHNAKEKALTTKNSSPKSIQKLSNAKAKPSASEPDFEAPSRHRTSKVQAKHTASERQAKHRRKSTASAASQPDSEAPSRHNTAKGKATRPITPEMDSENEQPDEQQPDEDAEQEDGREGSEQGHNAELVPGDEEDEEGKDEGEEKEEWGPDQTEISSSNMSTRPSSRASDVPMDDEEHPSDSSMRDLTGDQPFIPVNPSEFDHNQGANDIAKQPRKRGFTERASPSSPSLHRRSRRRLSNEFADSDESLPPLRSFKDYLKENEKNAETRATSTNQEDAPQLLAALPIVESGRPPPPQRDTVEWHKARIANYHPKQVNAAANSKAQPWTQPTSKPQCDPSETFSRLQGHSGRAPNAIAGPSSASTSLVGFSGRTAPANAASTIRAGPASGASSSSRPTIPTHRLPASYQTVTPPKPLPPKKANNPYAAKQKANERRR